VRQALPVIAALAALTKKTVTPTRMDGESLDNSSTGDRKSDAKNSYNGRFVAGL
jgi:hypothetical protein